MEAIAGGGRRIMKPDARAAPTNEPPSVGDVRYLKIRARDTVDGSPAVDVRQASAVVDSRGLANAAEVTGASAKFSRR